MSYGGATSASLARVTQTLQDLLSASLAPATQAAYTYSWWLFQTFTVEHNIAGNLPVFPSVLALFVASLYNQGYAAATISSHVSAIGYAHKLGGYLDPTDSFLVQKTLHACRKRLPQIDTRLPIDKTILSALIKALDHTVQNQYLRHLFQAMFALAFHAFLRIGEMTIQKVGAHNPNLLTLADVSLSGQTLTVHFRSYKHSDGHPFSLQIAVQPLGSPCAVTLLQRYLRERGTLSGPLFQSSPGMPVTRAAFSNQLLHALQFCRLDPNRFKSHSFRIGAATTAHTMGFSDSKIRQLGRWKSNAFLKYIRQAERTSQL